MQIYHFFVKDKHTVPVFVISAVGIIPSAYRISDSGLSFLSQESVAEALACSPLQILAYGRIGDGYQSVGTLCEVFSLEIGSTVFRNHELCLETCRHHSGTLCEHRLDL